MVWMDIAYGQICCSPSAVCTILIQYHLSHENLQNEIQKLSSCYEMSFYTQEKYIHISELYIFDSDLPFLSSFWTFSLCQQIIRCTISSLDFSKLNFTFYSTHLAHFSWITFYKEKVAFVPISFKTQLIWNWTLPSSS